MGGCGEAGRRRVERCPATRGGEEGLGWPEIGEENGLWRGSLARVGLQHLWVMWVLADTLLKNPKIHFYPLFSKILNEIKCGKKGES
jgi:hypothetical protein